MILVVSADNEIRQTLVRTLSASGEIVESATTTREGLQRAHDARTVVIDLLSAGINGDAFTGVPAAIVVVGVYDDVPVIIGADCYLKPFSLGRLIEAVKQRAAHTRSIPGPRESYQFA